MVESQMSLLTEIPGELQAEIFRGLLEANEIPVLLSQEGIAKVYGLTFTDLGIVQIFVPNESLQLAQQILADYKSGKLENSLGDEDDNPISKDSIDGD
ncbi:MAG: DUF2007 domain-containing protein [Chloroflexota bacterium]|jgi:hypothetical protein